MASSSTTSINLGLLETFVPLSSILTVCVAVGYVLPRHAPLGLFLLLWWWMAVLISLSTAISTTNNDTNIWLIASPNSWSQGDGWGLLFLVGCNAIILGFLWAWWTSEDRGKRRHRNKSKSRFWGSNATAIKTFTLQKVPLWSMIALHIYRLDGLSIIMPFYHGKVPSFIGFQTIVLDVWMGATAIPFLWALHPKLGGGVDRLSKSPRWKDALWLWNSLGLYDLCSAYIILILNWMGVGGSWITEPPLSRLGFHPFPLLILFQVPLAIAIHVLCLTQMDAIIEQQQSLGQLPLHVRRIRAQRF